MAGASDFVAAPQAVRLACSNCNAPVSLRTPGHTTIVTCSSCGSLLDATTPGLKVWQRGEETKKKSAKATEGPAIPLGTRGVLDGTEWEVVGYMVRGELKWKVFWREYLLFHPLSGFRWLVENDGHWTLMRTVTDPLSAHEGDKEWNGGTYKIFNVGTATVVRVEGEFYWRVKVGDAVQAFDYIKPPELLSIENTADEETASVGTYISPQQVQQAFPQATLPRPRNVAPNQPTASREAVTPAFVIALVATLVLWLASMWQPAPKAVFQKQMAIAVADTSEQIIGAFDLADAENNLEVRISTYLNNDWMYLAFTLFNETTGETFFFDKNAEYYHGVDGGESWSEGNRAPELFFTDLPAGKYTLTMQTERDAANAQDPSIQSATAVEIIGYTNVPVWSPFWIGGVLIWAAFLIVFAIYYYTEVQRWQHSDYSPYNASA